MARIKSKSPARVLAGKKAWAKRNGKDKVIEEVAVDETQEAFRRGYEACRSDMQPRASTSYPVAPQQPALSRDRHEMHQRVLNGLNRALERHGDLLATMLHTISKLNEEV